MSTQYCMEIRTLKRDVVRCKTRPGGVVRVEFKSPNGSSKFALMMTHAQAMEIAEHLWAELHGREWREEVK